MVNEINKSHYHEFNNNTAKNEEIKQQVTNQYIWLNPITGYYMLLKIQMSMDHIFVDLKKENKNIPVQPNNLLWKQLKGYTTCGRDVDRIEIEEFIEFIRKEIEKEYNVPMSYMDMILNNAFLFYF